MLPRKIFENLRRPYSNGHFSAFQTDLGQTLLKFNSSDGRVVKVSTVGAVDSGLIPSRVKPMTLKVVFTASLLDAQH